MKILKTLGMVTLFVALVNISSYAQKSEERKVDSFNQVKVSQAINCYLKEGAAEKSKSRSRRYRFG